MNESIENDKLPFWKQRHRNAGRPKLFESPEMMLDAANEYFELTLKRHWKTDHWTNGGKHVEKKQNPPFTIIGFCLFIGASRSWWNQFKIDQEKAKNTEFLRVIWYVSEMIELHQIEGASVGAFNGNIISRLIGLVDKKETEVKATVFRVGYKKPEEDEA